MMALTAEVLEAEPPPAQPPPPPRRETCRHCGQPIQTCRSCAAFIIWVVTAKGQRMPVDAAVTAIFDFPEGDDETKIRAYTSVPADPLPIHDAANHEPCPGCSPEAPR